MRWLRRLAVGLLLVMLAAVPVSAQTSPLPSGTYLLEFFLLDDECGHDPFIEELPESVTIEVGDDGGLTITGPEPWVEVVATVDADGSIFGVGLGTVAGFSDVSVVLEGELVEPGVLQGELSFGVGGELPGDCPIIWQLTLISESPVAPTTTSSTTTTTTSEPVDDTTGVVATTPTTTVAPTTTVVVVPGGEASFPWIILILVGIVLLLGGSFWWWVLRTPHGYGPGMVILLGGLSTTPQPDDPTDTTTETTTETTTTTTEETTTTTSEPDETTTEERDDTTTTTDETTTEERDDTTTTAEETTTEEPDETTTKERDDTDTTTDDTTTEDRADTATTEGGGTRDGTTVFGPRTRPRDDCKELVDECERLHEEANRLAAIAKRLADLAARARSRCERAKAAAKRAQKHLDDLEPRTNVERYYERMAWAQQDLRRAQTGEREACAAVGEAESDAAGAKTEAAEAAARAAEACARAKECLDNPPGTAAPGLETPGGTEAPSTTDPGGAASVERRPLPTSRCGPEAGERFLECMNRILSRLVVLFGRDAWRVTGYLFLTANGGAMDYWILTEYLDPPCHCPSQKCNATVTLFGECYPHHVMSDFMYGFFAAWFGLSDTEISAGSAGWKAWKYAANGFEGELATPSWDTVSQPSYAAGAAAAREILPDVNLDLRRYHITEGLAAVAKRSDCEACPCKSEMKPDRDFSVNRWNWDEPIEIMSRWAVTGEDPPQ